MATSPAQTALTLRLVKGSPLTNQEGDDNFSHLNAGKLDVANNLSDVTDPVAAATNLGVVKKAGDTMTGPLVLPADPNAAMQAATKQYVDTQVAGAAGGAYTKAAADAKFVDVAGDTMTGPLVLPADPASAMQASTKQYVDAQVAAAVAGAYTKAAADAKFVDVAGDTMTGTLTLAGNPVNPLDASTKQYVDSKSTSNAIVYAIALG